MLGDAVAKALEAVGVSEQSVSRWLGGSCGGCRERREKLNMLHGWAMRVVSGRVAGARDYLMQILGEES